jgi:hypothetical protein
MFALRLHLGADILSRTESHKANILLLLAEREGFEPPVPYGTTVFKTAAFDRSATSPDLRLLKLTKTFYQTVTNTGDFL